MSVLQQLPPNTRKRLPIIVDYLIRGYDYNKIATKCQVTRRTIERDVREWKVKGGFEQLVTDEWISLYSQIKKIDPIEAFRNLTKLKARMLTQKIDVKKEVKTEHKTEVSVLIKQYEQVINRVANRNLQQNNPTKPVHTTHADT